MFLVVRLHILNAKSGSGPAGTFGVAFLSSVAGITYNDPAPLGLDMPL